MKMSNLTNVKSEKTYDKTVNNNMFYEKAIVIYPYVDYYDKEEIIALAKTAKVDVIELFFQKIKDIHPATYFGIGKLFEISEFIKLNNIDCVIFDGELSPSQTVNIMEILEVKVIDRTTLILDIFALNAVTGEGKLQVELAQLKRLYPRLKGKGSTLSRLGGGIGTRGPGETQLETDRRHIKTRILYLEKALARLSQTRNLQTERRKKEGIKSVALVGYTNAGKTTIMNALTSCNNIGENKLFATLDTKGAKLDLDDFEILLFDTVGFIKNIPTDLIEAFKSTLSVALSADLILNVCDLTQDFNTQINTTLSILNELGCKSEIITVFNKCDATEFSLPLNSVVISAKKHLGIEQLKNVIKEKLYKDYVKLKFMIPYEKNNDYIKVKKFAEKIKETYLDNVIITELIIKKEFLNKFNSLLNYIST